MKPLALSIECADGTTLSVQASAFHYCTPRDDNGPYVAYEVGFIEREGQPVTPPDLWRKFADGDEFPNNVYGWVPRGMVEDFVRAHGGLTAGEWPLEAGDAK